MAAAVKARPLVVEARKVAQAMAGAAAIVERRGIIPILSHVKLAATGGVLEVTTSDLDVEYRQRIELESPVDLAITVDAQHLSELAKVCADGAQMSLEMEDKRLVVKSGRSRWVFPTLPCDDFPQLVPGDLDHGIELPAKDLAAMIARVIWSVSAEETRYYLCGIFFHEEEVSPGDRRLRLAATNDHTLMVMTTELAWPRDAGGIIVRTKMLRAIERLCADRDDIARLEWSGEQKKMRLTVGDTVLTAKTVDGVFPNYRRLIPATDGAPRTMFDPAALTAALRRVGLVASEKTRAVKVERENGVLVLSVNSAEGGTAREEIHADCAPGGFPTAFNTKYLADIAGAIGGDTLEVFQSDDSSPVLVRRLVPDGALGIIMPMRV